MNPRLLLRSMRERGVSLTAHDGKLRVDAPAGVLNADLKAALVENKPDLLRLLEQERRKLKAAHKRGLLIRWSRHHGWIALHDPTTGEWHEIRARDALPSLVEAANRDLKGA